MAQRRGGAGRVLTARELNRATLSRQLLLERSPLPAVEAIARVAGLQAQVPNPPYLGLWSRLESFSKDDLTGAMARREVIRAPLMRSTLHLVTTDDFRWLRPALQPALDRALAAFFGRATRGVDTHKLAEAARPYVEQSPRTMTELRAFLGALEPGIDPEALAYAVRTRLPLVQVPPGGAWGSGGSPAYALGEAAEGDGQPDLVRRYLAAFGPATVQDVQAWSGLTGLKPAVEALRPELLTFRDESGAELFDIPAGPLPLADTPAPVRLLPEYDNLILSHADRTRLVPDAHRSRIYLSAARVRATFLVDGVVAGVWKLERAGKTSTLALEPFAPLPSDARDALAAEAESLLRFAADGVPGAVRFSA